MNTQWVRSGSLAKAAIGRLQFSSYMLTKWTFLQGMSDFATEIGIIDATGQIPGVRVQGSYTACRTVSTCACIWQLADSLIHSYLLSQEHKRYAPRLIQRVAVHAEEWNSIAEGGPEFYTAHLMPPEPQPSLASMQQGVATSCL